MTLSLYAALQFSSSALAPRRGYAMPNAPMSGTEVRSTEVSAPLAG